MPKPSDADLMASMGTHKPRAIIAEEIENTIFGQVAAEGRDTSMIPVERIRPSPYQSRAKMSDEHIEALMASIQESGLLVPVIVRKVSNFDSPEKVSNFDTFELVAGHNRLEAFKRLGRLHIPAIVRPLSDRDAARALTVENTHHKNLTDWELYKHLKMLREAGAVKNVTDLAAVLGVGRTHIYNLEAFGALPEFSLPLLDIDPHMIGGRLAYDLKEYSQSHPDIVFKAISLLFEHKLKQANLVAWVKNKIKPHEQAERAKFKIGQVATMTARDGEVVIKGDINFKRLHVLIEANLDSLIDPPASKGGQDEAA